MPTTEAGRRLVRESGGWHAGLADAIEAEAVAAERARIRAAVEGLKSQHDDDNVSGWYFDGWNDASAAVLAIVRGEQP